MRAGQFAPWVAVMAVLGLALAVALRRRVVVGVNEHPGVVAVQRHTTIWRVIGLVVSVVVVVVLLQVGAGVSQGRPAAIAPALGGVIFLLAAVLGEVTARAPQGMRRTATLETRTPRQVAPRQPLLLAACSVVLLGALLAIGTALGSPDDLGRPGRSISQTCLDHGIPVTGRFGPWPGSFYALPIGVGLVACVTLTALALVVIARRARPGADSAELDATLRTWSASRVLRGLAVVAFATTAPVAGFMGSGFTHWDCGSAVAGTASVLAGVVGLGSGVLALGVLGGLLVGPKIVVDDLPRPLPGDSDPIGIPVR